MDLKKQTAVVSFCHTNPLHVFLLYIHQSSLWSSSLPPACTIPPLHVLLSPRKKTQHSFLLSLAHTSTFVGSRLPAPCSQYRSQLLQSMETSDLICRPLRHPHHEPVVMHFLSCVFSRSTALSDLLCIFSSTLSNVTPVALSLRMNPGCCSLIVPGFKNVFLYVHGMADQLHPYSCAHHPPKTFHFCVCVFVFAELNMIWFVGVYTQTCRNCYIVTLK